MKYCPTCDLRYEIDDDYSYPVCTNCKDDIIAEFDFDGVDWKFYWKIHTLKNTLMELWEMDLDDEQFNLVISNLKVKQ